MHDDLPVSPADLRALFERLDEVSATGYECDHTFALPRRFLTERDLPVDTMVQWLGENGAGCDCEVMFNVEQQWGERVGFVAKEEPAPISKPRAPSLRARRRRRTATEEVPYGVSFLKRLFALIFFRSPRR
jgi:hypothetical protein